MHRLLGLLLGLIVAVGLATTPLSAQELKEPKDNKWTKEANKAIGLAVIRPTPEEKKTYYEKALTELAQSFAKEPNNAKAWYLAGQAHVGLNNFAAADTAYDKAVEFYPPFAEQIEADRESAWVAAFNLGAQALNTRDYDAALQAFASADLMYSGRPEARLYMGLIAMDKGDKATARQAFAGALESARGPARANLKPEDEAAWKRYEDLAKLSLAQMDAQEGVEAFQANKYDEATAAFRKATEANPHNRDFVYNLGQSIVAGTEAMDSTYSKAKPAEQPKLAPDLIKRHSDVANIMESVRKLDPANRDVLVTLARAYRRLGQIALTPAERTEWQNKSLEVLKGIEAAAAEISDIAMASGGDGVTVRGTVKNMKATAGSPVKLRITLVGLDGSSIGAQDVEVPAPEAEKTADFETKVTVTSEAAGWKYELLP